MFYQCLVLYILIYTKGLYAYTSPLASCRVSPGRRQVCAGLPGSEDEEKSCLNADCCWAHNATYVNRCYKPEVLRTWSPCSKECNNGTRREKRTGWDMPCHTHPCGLRSACKCSGADVVFLVDASVSVGEQVFWRYKQLVIDVIRAYSQVGQDTRFAVITINAHGAKENMKFSFYSNFTTDNTQSLIERIWQIDYHPSIEGTFLMAAVTKAAKLFEYQARPDVPKIAIVVSDGTNTLKLRKFHEGVQMLHNVPATVYVMAPVKVVDRAPLDDLSTHRADVLTVEDYKDTQRMVEALVSGMCCLKGTERAAIIRCDDTCEIYVNGVYVSEVFYHEALIFGLGVKQRNLVAVKMTNTLNPRGHYFELWSTGVSGYAAISAPQYWRCNADEKRNWYSLDYSDRFWSHAALPPRLKDQQYMGAAGQRKIWAPGSEWQGFCRTWVSDVCNVTRLPNVTCDSSPTLSGGVCGGVFDGRLGGRSEAWIARTSSHSSSWMSLRFPFAVKIHTVRFMNRCQLLDQIREMNLTFPGGISRKIVFPCKGEPEKESTCHGGKWMTETFDPPVESSSLKVEIVESCMDSRHKRLGLREIEVLADPPCFV